MEMRWHDGCDLVSRERSHASRAPLAKRHLTMITKVFFIAKTFRAYGENFLRQEKSIRDHGGEAGRPT
jgi:hypothetical protein